jgi:tRNA threonylcarbamoyladenosine biosynthesis protein TsaB
MITLAIETSTSVGSIAAIAYKQVIFEETFTAERSHSTTLFASLERARSHFAQVEQVVVGLGPGSYSGVRIAISAAVGLQIGMGSQVFGIPSVVAFESDDDNFIAIGDARRETFYFTLVQDGICAEGPLLATEREVRDQMGRHPTLPVFSAQPLPAFPTVKIASPSAVKLAYMAARGQGIVQQTDLEPIYLREPNITQPKR